VYVTKAIAMTDPATHLDVPRAFPDHTQLPESDGTFVKNFQEHPQSILLTDSLGSVLERLHPDGQYCIGQDSGIYWRETDPPEKGAEAPDWFYVGGVPPQLGKYRRSYVLWRELITPTIVLEFASGDGSEERDQTPFKGKFWVYERVMRVPYYGIYEIISGKLEVYHLVDITYQKLIPNERGHYSISPMQVELGLWQGTYQNQEMLWLRWWDATGNLLLIGNEQVVVERQRAEQEHQRAEQEHQRAEQERQRAEAAERELAHLRSLLQPQDPSQSQ
jgi:Uma2 family endonuclease